MDLTLKGVVLCIGVLLLLKAPHYVPRPIRRLSSPSPAQFGRVRDLEWLARGKHVVAFTP
jgi:hypothetical protein